MVSQTWVWCQSCELASQLTQPIYDRKLSFSHPGGTRKRRRRGRTSGQSWNCGNRKGASHTQIWLLKRTWKKRQKCSREWPAKQKTDTGIVLCHSQQKHNTHSLLAILPTDGGLRCEHQHPRPHRCQRSSTEDKQGKELSTTPTLRPAEQSEQSGWKESSLERAGQNPDRSRLEWRPDHRARIHWSTFLAEQVYSS